MKKGLLITLPRSDDVTEYLYFFSKKIIQECEKKGINVKSLEKSEVTKKNFISNLESYDYRLIVLNGHGEVDYVTGHKGEKLIGIRSDAKKLSNRITYARSCWAAAGLGVSCMKEGNDGCFIGYDIPFMFLMDTTWASNPIKDNTAKIFFDTSNKVPLGLIKGKTTKQAHKESFYL